MRLIEWEVAEDGYEEQIVIPNENKVKGSSLLIALAPLWRG